MGRVYARDVLRFIFIVALLGTWFMPLIIAALYKLPHQGRIAVLSLALGWTGVGWLAALVIAVGGAIRATRPALAGQAQPEALPAPGAYAAATPKAPAQPALARRHGPRANPVPGADAGPAAALVAGQSALTPPPIPHPPPLFLSFPPSWPAGQGTFSGTRLSASVA